MAALCEGDNEPAGSLKAVNISHIMGSTERGAEAVKSWFRSEAADFYDTKIDPMAITEVFKVASDPDLEWTATLLDVKPQVILHDRLMTDAALGTAPIKTEHSYSLTSDGDSIPDSPLSLQNKMDASGVGELVFIEDLMKKEDYLHLLQHNLVKSAEKLGIEKEFMFYQNNDPKHNSYTVQEFLLYKCPKVLHPPPQSPDLNPNEHLWEELDRRVGSRTISSKEELKA
ncbi:hypothetical protein ANN_02480 [Periplaneta americana]|uniref:Tc1-like transposase DDE domain-containing protein n=1 Tax=Periplaneta americana TaxID=6978 RepID=A0ABQ8TWI0_PERAM|nr:hypothetical protein ANN_02480 [Periplaneta americana]